MTDLAWMTIAELAPKIRSGEVGAAEATQAYLERIDRVNGDLKAYISVYPDQALAAARAADAALSSGADPGPLHGVPLGIKDLFLVKDMVRTCGSRLIHEGPAAQDAASVAALRAGGAVMLGLTNLHEFAFGPTGINPHVGTARNPWNTDKVCGGSSSGSGCAVAAGLAAGAMGTDTGGSVRLPAGLCGIVGLKPTHLRVSQDGIYPLVGEFDTGGPMARSVADIALMMAALDPAARFAAYAPRPDLAGIRLGVLEAMFADGVDSDIRTITGTALRTLGDLKAEIEPVSLPFAGEALAAWNTITLARVYALHGARAEAADSKLTLDVRDRVLTGRDISAAQLDQALSVWHGVRAALAETMARFDALVLPTVPIEAVNVSDGMGDVDGDPVSGAAVLGRLTRFASFTGQPAISVPSGLTSGGLPAGLQLIGRWGDDEALLEIAGCYEAASGWNRRTPPAYA